ncbi:MAG TPA: serine/threonine-protein kinase, partial [Polyangiaceae bacterium]
ALLGVGGMASVYAATHRNGKRAAVKVLHFSAAHDNVVRARFLREGYVANRVEHPGAVSVLDDDVDEDGTVFLVMELLSGETIEDRRIACGGTMPVGDVLSSMEQVLDVLAAAHAKHIVHRDLKPGNLFITSGGAVKVLDFGIARLADMTQPRTATTSFSSSMGTLGFMAPEQARGRWELVDARTDLWSIGATMFTLLSGRYVHEAGTANEQLLEAMTKPAPPLASYVPNVHPEAAKVVVRALLYERADRWQSAKEMQAALRAAYEVVTGRPLATAPRLSISGRVPDVTVQHAPTLPAVAGPISDPNATGPRRAAEAATGPTMRGTRRAGMAVAGAVAVTAIGVFAMTMRRGGAPAQTAATPSAPAAAASDPPAAPSASAAAAAVATVEATAAASDAPVAPAASASTAPAAATSTMGAPHKPAAHGAPATAKPSATPAPTPSATVDIFERRR